MSTRTGAAAPTCPGCSSPSKRELLRDGITFCGVCWTEVPTKVRKAVKDAARDLGRWPSSAHHRAAADLAVREAVAHVR